MLTKNRNNLISLGAVALLILILAAPALAAQEIAVERIGPTSIAVEAQRDFQRAFLRVVGPRGYQLERSFEAGSTIQADLFAAQ